MGLRRFGLDMRMRLGGLFRRTGRSIKEGFDFLLDTWDKLFPSDPTSPTKLYTANRVATNSADQSYIEYTPVTLTGDWEIFFVQMSIMIGFN